MELDVVIFGGGCAGLWTLDELSRRGYAALLLEAGRLGGGQTAASQGILHGGMKYALAGLLTPSASGVRDMPAVWRGCLAGRCEPDLSATRVRSDHCYLWQTQSFSSRLGMWGAQLGLQVAPQLLAQQSRPAVLAGCPGRVARLDEQVIAPASLVENLFRRNSGRILRIDADRGLELLADAAGALRTIRLKEAERGAALELRPRRVIFAAGAGNESLRSRVGLRAPRMQRRPLHMVMLRGLLPELNGHCIDGARTRVTITSDLLAAGRTVWQVGGQLAEDGVRLQPAELIARAAAELAAVIPGVNLSGTEWATYRVDRAERIMPGGRRPESVQILAERNVLTAWPTKLVLAPKLAEELIARLEPPEARAGFDPSAVAHWPRPETAAPPWETATDWVRLEDQPRRDAAA